MPQSADEVLADSRKFVAGRGEMTTFVIARFILLQVI